MLALAGCAGPSASRTTAVAPSDTPAAASRDLAIDVIDAMSKDKAPEAPAPHVSPTPAAPLIERLEDGTVVLQRPALRKLVAMGAQQFIRLVEVRPAFRKRRFFGWRVLAYHGPGALIPGDIIVRVNGRSIERPEQFIGVWNVLADDDALVLEMVRGGRSITRRYPIVD